MAPPTVAVLGLGLIGGSLARDLAAAGALVLGYDRDADAVADACAAGVVTHRLEASLSGVADADWIVLATPVDVAPELLTRLCPFATKATLVTDVGSTKRRIVAVAEQLGLGGVFVGSHPLAGDTRSGWHASRAGLFAGSRVFLCPTRGTRPHARREAVRLWESCHATTETLEAAAHDRRLAWTSHLPQLAATALALALGDADIAVAELGPGGRDATRLAASGAETWTAVARENADRIAPALAALEDRLREMRLALEGGDPDALHLMFEGGAAWAAQKD